MSKQTSSKRIILSLLNSKPYSYRWKNAGFVIYLKGFGIYTDEIKPFFKLFIDKVRDFIISYRILHNSFLRVIVIL